MCKDVFFVEFDIIQYYWRYHSLTVVVSVDFKISNIGNLEGYRA